MSTELPNPEDQLHFLQKIQLLLEEGKFTSTYKYALLMALADLSVEYGDVGGNPLTLKVSVISQKLIEYYWRQTIPFPSHHAATLLLQNKGNQAAMINNIRLIHEQHSGSISRAIQDEQEWCALINGINGIVQEMPLWKLQTFSRGIDEFMYPNTGEGSEITLYPGVAYHLRSFHGLIHNMVQGAWTRWIRRLRQNQEIIGQNINLEEFLFGEERSNLSVYASILREHQQNRCFYCGDILQANSHAVDHFIPWVRYPYDLAHNFVLTHPKCNRDKRDLLAATEHLEKWKERNIEDKELVEYFDERGLVHNYENSHAIAVWAYEQTEVVMGDVWVSTGNTRSISNDWRAVFA